MRPEDILTRAGDQLGIRRVLGEPIRRDGVTVVTVAVSIGGGGTGTGPEDQGSAGGFGGMVRGIGATITNGQVDFVPAVDTTALAAMFVTAVSAIVRARRPRRG